MSSKTAYISVCDKTGIADLADGLINAGFQIYSGGSTAKTLRQAELIIEEITDVPPSCESVIKALTLNPDDMAGRRELEKLEISRPDLVVANLYPLSQILQQKNFTIEEIPQYLDVWNSAVLRAAARSFSDTIAICDPMDYGPVLEALLEFGDVTLERKKQLAAKAYLYSAYYDSTIAQYLSGRPDILPDELVMGLKKLEDLQYGENHHQKAAIYSLSGARSWGVTAAKVLNGKPLNFNHYLDIDAAWELAGEFEEAACSIVKHSHPCGTACSEHISEAFRLAFRADAQGAFGGTAAFNRPVDAETARAITEEFVECVVAPEYSEEALSTLKLKKDLRVLTLPSTLLSANENQMYTVSGGVLVEDKDVQTLPKELKTVTKRAFSDTEARSLKLAWKVAKHSKSYAMVLAHGGQTIGIGSGQPSRLDSLKIAISKANEKHPIIEPDRPLVLASDSPLPIRCIEEASKTSVTAILQPGGSSEDNDCVKLCDLKGMAMAFTGLRHLKH